MRVRSADPKRLWTDYTVTNAVSGKTYRVALRGWKAGECYCTCPDFRTNTLGVCKHILHVQEKVTRQFSAQERRRPFVHRDIAVCCQLRPASGAASVAAGGARRRGGKGARRRFAAGPSTTPTTWRGASPG